MDLPDGAELDQQEDHHQGFQHCCFDDRDVQLRAPAEAEEPEHVSEDSWKDRGEYVNDSHAEHKIDEFLDALPTCSERFKPEETAVVHFHELEREDKPDYLNEPFRLAVGVRPVLESLVSARQASKYQRE